ncbi:MAG: PIG-L family deacetylase [Planctomycetota bacterium]
MSVEQLTELRTSERRLLAVFPHPDDESYGPAGTLARAGADSATAVVAFCMTRGEASIIGKERGISPDEVAELRYERLMRVSDHLKLDAMLIGEEPDGKMAYRPLDHVSASIFAVLEAFRPQVVIAHDPRGVNAHPDHIATHWALRHALLRASRTRVAMLAYTEELVDAVKPRLLFATPEEDIDAVVRLSESEIAAKEACLREHDALVTLRDDGDPALLRRPPVERYNFLGESFDPPLDSVFAELD